MFCWRWSRPMLRPWKLSPASHSRHRAQTPSWGPLDRSGLSRLHIIGRSELGNGKWLGLVTTHQTEEGREGNSFLYEDYEEGPNLDGLRAQCACAGDGGAVQTAHARNTWRVHSITAAVTLQTDWALDTTSDHWPHTGAVDRGKLWPLVEEVQRRLSVMRWQWSVLQHSTPDTCKD